MKPFREQNYYELLELTHLATEGEIRSAYQRLEAQYSDDSVALYGLVEPGEARQLRARLLEAMEFLTEPELRIEYDRSLGLPPRPAPPQPPPEDEQPRQLSMIELLSTADAMQSTYPRYQVSYIPHPANGARDSSAVVIPAPENVAAVPSPFNSSASWEGPGRAASLGAVPAEPVPEPAPPAEVQARPVAVVQEASPEQVTLEAAAPAIAPPELAAASVAPAPSAPQREPERAVAEWVAPQPLSAEPAPRPSSPSPAGSEVVYPRPTPPPLRSGRSLDAAQQLAQEAAIASAEAALAQVSAKIRESRAHPAVEVRPKPLEIPSDAEFNGELLRQVRQSRGISLEQLAERTRIIARHLGNIEADRYDALPVTVYLRGILMNIARELGLDPLRVSKSYLGLVGSARKQ